MTWTCPKCGTVHAEAGLRVLGPMERRALQQLVNGRSPMKAAAALGISYNTFRTHQQNIFHKLDVHSSVQAVVYAVRHGMSPEPLELIS